jgi:Tfp pilus assembly protein PilN
VERSEVIIGIGAGVTNVVVHQHGVPSFMRTVPSGGAAVTQALALHLGTGADEAEGLKRTVGSEGTELNSATLTAIEPVVGEVVGSLDFFRSSSGPGGIERVLLAGGGSRLEPLRHALADQLSVPIEIGDPYRGLRIGKVGIDPGVVQQSGDVFAAAIGLALSGVPLERDGRRINLLPADVEAKRAEQRVMVMAGAGLGVFALLLVGAGFVRGQQVSQTKADVRTAEAATATVNGQIAKLDDIQALQTHISTKQQEVTSALKGDLAWPALLPQITGALPPSAFLTSMTVTAATASSPGKVTMGGTASDHTDVAAFLANLGKVPMVDKVWLGSSSRSGPTGPVTFTATAEIAPAAASTRAAQLGGPR